MQNEGVQLDDGPTIYGNRVMIVYGKGWLQDEKKLFILQSEPMYVMLWKV
jgi:hypothetical protein